MSLNLWNSFPSVPQIDIAVGRHVELKFMFTGLFIAIAFIIYKWLRNLKAVNYLPGIRCIFAPFSVPGALLPTTWWNPGLNFPWIRRLELYKTFDSQLISVVPLVIGKPSLYTNNIDVARQVVAGGHKSCWIKPEAASQSLLRWGQNVAAAEGETWRRHRRIMGPAFNNRTYALVWDQTRQIYRDMIVAEGWMDKDVIEVPVVQKLTFKLAHLVIGTCGFGFPFTWTSPPTAADGKMTIPEAFRIHSEADLLSLAAPKWIFKLPIKWMRCVNKAHVTIRDFMHAQVAERRAKVREQLANNDISEGRDDVFSTIVKANEMEGKGKLQLDEAELIGNIFVLLFAGHETTGSAIAAIIGMLSINEEIQDELYDHIISVIGDERDPTFEDYSSFGKLIAAFYEAVRLFPAGSVLIREATEDTVLTVPNSFGGNRRVPVSKGTMVVVDMIGVQYNPIYFENPEAYMPSRWYGENNQADAVTAFSVGPRACIGRKFATSEAVCFLALFLRDWKVEPILNPGESKKLWQDRVLQGRMTIAMELLNVPVKLVARKRLAR